MSKLSAKNEEANANRHPIAAVAQLRSTSDKFQNLLDIATCAKLATSKGACMLFLPEAFGFIGEYASHTLEEAEDPSFLSVSSSDSERESSSDIDPKEKTEKHELTRILKSVVSGGSEEDENDTSKSSPLVVHSLMDGLRTIAKESGLWISGGGIHIGGAPRNVEKKKDESENRPENFRVYNTHVILDSSGVVVASYRKIHLFDVSIPGKFELRESRSTAPGTELVACDSPIGRLGLTTCYDIRFPEMYTELTTNFGAQILLVPAAFTVPTGAAHWHVLLRARAIENQCYVLAAAQCGVHNQKRKSFGHSLAVDPWGKVIADAGGYPTVEETESNHSHPISRALPDCPSIITAEIDLASIDSIRQRIPIDLHRANATF